MIIPIKVLTPVCAGLLLFAATSIRIYAAPDDLQQTVSAKKFVDLQQGDSQYKGYRRAHAKGICVTGAFYSNGRLSDYTNAPLFTESTTSFTGRFSIAGNNPRAADLGAPVRSFALNFVLAANNQWRIAMNTPPVMAVTNPQDFYAQLIAIKQGGEAITAFFNDHPESKDFLAWKSQ